MKSIGVAVGQMVTKTARPLCALKALSGEPDWFEVEKLLREWQPDAVVVGIPFTMKGENLPVTKPAQNFIKELRERFKLKVFAAEERLTTKEARANLFAADGFRGLKKDAIDAVSAKIILESWMGDVDCGGS